MTAWSEVIERIAASDGSTYLPPMVDEGPRAATVEVTPNIAEAHLGGESAG